MVHIDMKVHFEQFMRWRSANNAETFSECDFLVYFEKLSKKYKASKLWSTLSILKIILKTKENINLGKYMKHQAFLKRKLRAQEVYDPDRIWPVLGDSTRRETFYLIRR